MRLLTGAAFALFLSGLVTAQVTPPAASRSVWDGVYTESQSERGRAAYRSGCAHCHGDTLEGDAAPTLTGPFWSIWDGRTAADLFKMVRATMPADAPESLPAQEYADILAYMFSVNKFPTGSSELGSDAAALAGVQISKESSR